MEKNKQGNNLIEVDYELIRQMRRDGKGKEADALINAFHQNLKENKRIMNNELLTQDRIMKKHYKLCTIQCCMEKATKDSVFCEKHAKQLLQAARENYARKKEEAKLKKIEKEQHIAKQIQMANELGIEIIK